METDSFAEIRDDTTRSLSIPFESVEVVKGRERITVKIRCDSPEIASALTTSSLERLRRKLTARYGELLDIYILESELTAKLSDTLLLLLEINFPGFFKRVAISSPTEPIVDLWITPIKQSVLPPSEKRTFLEETCIGFLSSVGRKMGTLEIVGEKPAVAIPILLRCIKVKQPTTLQNLALAVQAEGFAIGKERVLENQVDKLIKRGFVQFVPTKPNGKYVLTSSGLEIAKSGIGRRSSDIARALELARRHW